MNKAADVVVVGGGVIGTAVAFYTARQGLKVTLVDLPKRGRATSASAGGLWSLGESVGLGCGVIFHKARLAKGTAHKGTHAPPQMPKSFLNFAMASNAMFPKLADDLRELAGMDIEYDRNSLLFLMYDDGDEAFARQLWKDCPCGRSLSEWVTPEELAKVEPALTRETRGALRFNGDDQVNPYRLADAFREACRALGGTVLTHTEVTGLRVEGNRVTAVETSAGTLPCAMVVNAAGAWAAEIGRMVGIELPVYPVRGQIVGTETLPKILHASVSTTDCYLAQKQHGEIIIGSTTEDVGFDTGVTSSAMRTLSAGAIRAVPMLKRVGVKRAWSGLRPGSPDELPILGPVTDLGGYLNACGHFRTGILNAPLTGLVVAELAAEKVLSFPIEPFLLSRFTESRSTDSHVPAVRPGHGEFDEATLFVPSMKCEGCERTIRDALQDVASVYEVRLEMSEKSIHVRYERSPLALTQVKTALASAGFEAVESRP
jgi:glycine/D-amino acid oxidase-like deaminating enzyme/copper chaperone CopZ